ncbi:MAG: hypothetical protein CLLPBCKN_005046 [Chroococcidiopsis cubana SAG 39.79]|uniref:Tc1-like transposase DDE domain-containing protein n=1 Tax=Chroococcidiopsis cubana SAG 39.79 TaxID=388085 RepID=A0AB37USG1_9CYAN|nr:hypothetical protein [Chroococcidiopsis cubana]MDZ4875626.1 hypothetical protein [Chroococcidiopsis cubana SAG 39.79]PSB64845.1 hypothetical protein C7B79_08030 [Chroococcidiopsis cubana CCALA 043]RUT14398.1 hypothetical protein DSM107010_04290 [Chroococcidiopsis cubana SAG 39.79]
MSRPFKIEIAESEKELKKLLQTAVILVTLKQLLAQGKCVYYLCQDETRVGLKTLTGKVITASGVKPTVGVKWQWENFWIYGAIEPLTGDHFLESIQN